MLPIALLPNFVPYPLPEGALSDAIASCGEGYPALDAPATAERVFLTVERVRHGV